MTTPHRLYPEHLREKILRVHSMIENNGHVNIFMFGPAASGKTYIAKDWANTATQAGCSNAFVNFGGSGLCETAARPELVRNLSMPQLLIVDDIELDFSDTEVLREVIKARDSRGLSTVLIVIPNGPDAMHNWFHILEGTGRWMIMGTHLDTGLETDMKPQEVKGRWAND